MSNILLHTPNFEISYAGMGDDAYTELVLHYNQPTHMALLNEIMDFVFFPINIIRKNPRAFLDEVKEKPGEFLILFLCYTTMFIPFVLTVIFVFFYLLYLIARHIVNIF